jgi:hypothetical protein
MSTWLHDEVPHLSTLDRRRNYDRMCVLSRFLRPAADSTSAERLRIQTRQYKATASAVSRLQQSGARSVSPNGRASRTQQSATYSLKTGANEHQYYTSLCNVSHTISQIRLRFLLRACIVGAMIRATARSRAG